MTGVLPYPEIMLPASTRPVRDVIFLTHRIPYPPDKGDKIRSFHLLQGLSRHYRVHLGTFIDDPDDRRFRDVVAGSCASACFVDLVPSTARFRSLSGLFTGVPLTFAFYRSRRLARWVKQVRARHNVHALIAFSGCMAQYAKSGSGPTRILDLVDVDSEKWAEYSRVARGPIRWLYQREHRCLGRAEIRLAYEFNHTVLVSPAEADLLRNHMTQATDRVAVIRNGVDVSYFDPAIDFPDPYPRKNEPVAVFVGAMDYRANVDAVLWFTKEVWPTIRAACPTANFWIVGARPVSAVRALDRQTGVFVTGRVPDVRPYLRFANVAVAPLRIARGVQNKILEALAMELPVVATPQAWEGIDPAPPDCGQSTEYPKTMAKEISMYFQGPRQATKQGRRFVMERYAWNQAVHQFLRLIERCPQAAGDSTASFADR